MTRIISGQARGRKLQVPTTGTRPTSDRVREAVFNIVGNKIDFTGCAVLDLYAGSGALGLEALSRGAQRALLVDSHSKAIAVLTANCASLGFSGAQPRRTDVATLVQTPATTQFDLVFIDPPYELPGSAIADVLASLAANGWLTEAALIVIERATRSTITELPQGFTFLVHKKYGETRIELLEFTTSAEAFDE